MLYTFCGASYAVAEVDERTSHLLSFYLIEAAFASVAVNAIHLVVEPRR